jgi:hypothetical protein
MGIFFPLLAILVFISPSVADEIDRFDVRRDAKPQQIAEQKTTCSFPDLKLPQEFKVFAAGAYSGRKLSFQIDLSGHEGTQIDVTVNNPSKPVILLLGAYEPTIWKIDWSAKTKILAVLVSGNHRQVVAGLGKTTPVLISTHDNRGACDYFVIPAHLSPLNPLSRRLFGRPVDMVFPANNGKVIVGEPLSAATRLVSSGDVTPESFQDKSRPIAGLAGLEDAVRKGLLRKATAADGKAWSELILKNSPKMDLPPVFDQGIPRPPQSRVYREFNTYVVPTYVVLKPFIYPAGLYGAHSAIFFIPKGVPKPEGTPGHSTVYDFNTQRCQGPSCNNH